MFRLQRLPAEYQEVEYVASAGNDWVDVGFVSDTEVAYDIEYYQTASAAYPGIVGAGNVHGHYICFNDRDISGTGDYPGRHIHIRKHEWHVPTEDGTDKQFELNRWSHLIVKLKAGSYATTTIFDGHEYSRTTGLDGTSLAPSSAHTGIFAGTSTGSWPISARIRYCVIYSNIAMTTMARCLIPCYRKSDTKIGFYDTVGNTFYTSANNKLTKGADVQGGEVRAIKMDSKDMHHLRDASNSNKWFWGWSNAYFEPLEYIESHGTESIDTGKIPVGNIKYHLEWNETDSTPSANHSLYGAWNGSRSGYAYVNKNSSDNWQIVIAIGNGNKFVIARQLSRANIDIEVNETALTIKYSLNNATAQQTTWAGSLNKTLTTHLFSGFYSNTVAPSFPECSKMKCYHFSITQNGTVIWDGYPVRTRIGMYIPASMTDNGVAIDCTSAATQVYGMYDSVSEKLFVNRGTGAFTGG